MIIVDLELSGLDVDRHSIIDIGAIDFFNPINRFDCQCNIREGAELDDKSLSINGYTKHQILTCECSLEKAIYLFHEWSKTIVDRTITGQSNDTDKLFLQKTFEFYGIKWDFGHRKVDIHSIAYAKALKHGFEIPLTDDKISNLNSGIIADFVNIPREIEPHKAINGAIWETEIMSRLTFGKNMLPEFKGYSIPDYLL